jgi:hypothetical protein
LDEALGQGRRTGGEEPQAGGAERQTGSAGNRTLAITARTHRSVQRTSEAEETDRTESLEDEDDHAEMRRVRRQEDPRCRNRAAAPTEAGEDAGQVTKPREEGARVEGGPLLKMPSLTPRNAGPIRGDCVKEGSARYANVHRLGEPVGGSRSCEFNGQRSLEPGGPGNPTRTAKDNRDFISVRLPGESPGKAGEMFEEQAHASANERTLGCRAPPAGGHAGPDRKGGLCGEAAAADATRGEGEVDREPGTVGPRIRRRGSAAREDGQRDTGEREAEAGAPRGDEPENQRDEPGNRYSRLETPCAQSVLCGPPSDPKTDRTEPEAAAAEEEGYARAHTRTNAAENLFGLREAVCPRSNREEEPENQEMSQRTVRKSHRTR